MVGKKPIVVVGSINVDLVANAERIPLAGETISGNSFQIHSGGKGANQAVAVARLGYPVRMIGCVGQDAFGTQLKEQLQSEGVDISGVPAVAGSSGVAIIVVSRTGENAIVVTPGANASVTPEFLESKMEILLSAGLILTQLEIPLGTVEFLAGICHRHNIPLILDPAPAKALPSTVLEQVEWFTPNETEAAFFLGDSDADRQTPASAAKFLIGKGVKGVALKLGARGAYLASATGLRESILPFPVKAADTTAAGDTFNGAFATGLMLHKGPIESARLAAAAAALSVTRAGAQPSMPQMAEVEKMLRDNGA